MRQFYLQKGFYHLARKAVIKPSELLGVSRATLYRWKGRMEREGWKGLEQRSRRPKHLRQRQWTAEEVEAIRSYRLLYPCWGKEKIKALLEKANGREGTRGNAPMPSASPKTTWWKGQAPGTWFQGGMWLKFTQEQAPGERKTSSTCSSKNPLSGQGYPVTTASAQTEWQSGAGS